MAIITLRQRFEVKPSDGSIHNSAFFLNAIPFIKSSTLYRIWTSDSTRTYDDIRRRSPQAVSACNRELTELVKFHIKNPRLDYLLERHQLKFVGSDVEILTLDFSDLNSITVVISFFTKEYNLLRNFGKHLLLSADSQDNSTNAETFTIKLNTDLAIHTYIE